MPRIRRKRLRSASSPPPEAEAGEAREAAQAPRRPKGLRSPCDKQYRAGLTK